MSVYIDERQPSTTFGLLSLRRRWKLIAACVGLAAMLGLLYTVLRPASYTASTQLLVYVKEVQPGPDLVISLGRADLTQVENESEVIRSRGTLAKVVGSLDLTEDSEFVPAATAFQGLARWLSGTSPATSDESRAKQEAAIESLARSIAVKRVGTSHTILVDVTTSDPEKSALIANGISQVMLQARLNAEQDGERSPLLRERLQGLGPSVYVMTPALAPDKPNGPRKILIIMATVMAGLVIGAALALFLDFRDKTIRSAAQIQRFGLECIGAIPLFKSGKPAISSQARQRAGQDRLPEALLAQTLLRATVAIEATKARTVGVASSIAGDGATTVARHLAQMAARSQRKVLLVEAGGSETSRSSAREMSSAPAFSGTQPQPLGGSLWNNGGDGPDLLITPPPGTGEGVANWWMHCDQTSLAAYDLIVVCLPALERGPEFRMAAQNIDGILLVMKWGGAEMERIERAFTVSGAAPSDFIGAVLNMVDDRMIGRFGDKLWEAEGLMAAGRGLFGPAMPIEPVAGSS